MDGGPQGPKFKITIISRNSFVRKSNRLRISTMTQVRKFEFVNNGVLSVVETSPETPKTSIPKAEGRFLRTWIGESGEYKVKSLKVSTSAFVAATLRNFKKVVSV